MYSLLFLVTVSFLLTLLFTPLVRNQAFRWGFVDQPDFGRKLHTKPIPRLGGVAIFASYLLAFGVLFLTPFQAVHLIEGGVPLAIRIAPAVILVFAIGIRDDLRSMRPWQKLIGQILAAGLAYAAGVHVNHIGYHSLPYYLDLPATIFWLVLCTNAVNLIDGVDGLATGVGVFATATTLLAALLQNNIDLALAVAPLLGCLLGFLRYNFNPATIFLGDCGSLFIGFFLGCCSIIWSQKSATILGMTAPLLALSIPLLDTVLSIARRFLKGEPLFNGDRGHVHHRLLDRGLTPRRVALIIYATCGLAATLALLMMNSNFQGVVVILFCCSAWIGIQHLGYVEFGVAGRMFVDGAFRRHLNTSIALKNLEDHLKSAQSPQEIWDVVENSAKCFGFHTVDMQLAGHHYAYYESRENPKCSWIVKIPLSEYDFTELAHEFDAPATHNVVGPFAEIIRRVIEPKLEAFSRARLLSPPNATLHATATAGQANR